ncbi:MAG: sigma-70 family RNA polymerase sigma factor [Planctomycetota bacterium]
MQHSDSKAKPSIFPTTHWTVINALKDASVEDKHALFTEFVEQYSPAFRVHLIHARGYRNDADIDDTIQGFIADKFVFTNILHYVQEGNGRLRNYLRRCLDNYVYDHHRSKAKVAWNNRIDWDTIGDDLEELAQPEATCPFDLAWADSVMTEAIVRTKDQFFHGQRHYSWDVFDLCLVRPLFFGVAPVAYADIAEQLGMSVKSVQNRRVSALRAFGKHLSAVIAEYVGNDPDLIQTEITELHKLMSSEKMPGSFGEI